MASKFRLDFEDFENLLIAVEELLYESDKIEKGYYSAEVIKLVEFAATKAGHFLYNMVSFDYDSEFYDDLNKLGIIDKLNEYNKTNAFTELLQNELGLWNASHKIQIWETTDHAMRAYYVERGFLIDLLMNTPEGIRYEKEEY
jgi:hypothetical protein